MKKEKLFRKGVQSLKSISDLDLDYYVCPICLRGFEKESIRNKELSLEHVPPQSIGGKEILLTCVNCNNEAGHKIDAELHKREKVQSIPMAIGGLDKFEGRIILKMGGLSINTNVTIEDGHIQFIIPENINDPQKRAQLINHLKKLTEGGWDDEKFNIQSIVKYHKHKVKVAYLKSAYLAAFAALGYSYILRKEFNLVRDQIRNPRKEIIPEIFLSLSYDKPKERKIIFINEPLKTILVQIDHTLVFLPHTDWIDDPFSDIVNYISKNKSFKILSGKDLSWPNKMEMVLDKFTASE